MNYWSKPCWWLKQENLKGRRRKYTVTKLWKLCPALWETARKPVQLELSGWLEHMHQSSQRRKREWASPWGLQGSLAFVFDFVAERNLVKILTRGRTWLSERATWLLHREYKTGTTVKADRLVKTDNLGIKDGDLCHNERQTWGKKQSVTFIWEVFC